MHLSECLALFCEDLAPFLTAVLSTRFLVGNLLFIVEKMESDMEERHRQEKKDLKTKIQKLRSSVSQGDKKRKKEVNAEIDRLEKELKDQQQKELQESTCNGMTSELKDLSLETSNAIDSTQENGCSSPTSGFKYSVREVSKAEKKRQKKRLEQQQKEHERQSEDVSHLRHNKDMEVTKLNRLLQERGLNIHEIPSDGDCLYKSVEHQLSIKGRKTTVTELRASAADFMRSHSDDFMPFIPLDSDDGDLEKEFDKYCKVIETTNSWGGHLELQALSRALDVVIEVIQADGPVITFGDEVSKDKPRLFISYHRHAYSLGEHYNSLVKRQ